MQKIYLKKYKGQGDIETLAAVIFNEEGFSFEGDEAIISLLTSGLPHPTDPTLMTSTDDGQLFIDAMFRYFDSPYLYAEFTDK